jgi:tetratricopeptide (TPR) repeat protein
MDGLHYEKAAALLNDVLIDMRDFKGRGYHSQSYGSLGICYFQCGDARKASDPMRRALEYCEEEDDSKGVAAYLVNLIEIHRYLGESKSAATLVLRLADCLDQSGMHDQATAARQRALILQKGEPLIRIVVVTSEGTCELDALPKPSGLSLKFDNHRNRISLKRAEALTALGQMLAESGQLEEALRRFEEAAKVDPFDPEPRYHAGLSLLYLERYEEAVESFRATERLAPGWFFCRSNLWVAEQLAAGRFQHKYFLVLSVMESDGSTAEQKAQIAESALTAEPDFVPLYPFLGKNVGDVGGPRAAEAVYRRGLARAEERDVRTRLLLELAILLEPGAERRALFREAAELNGNLAAGAMASVALRFDL